MTAITKGLPPRALEQWLTDAFVGGYPEPAEVWPQEMLLDPLAWQAVGKTRGWNGMVCIRCGKLDRDTQPYRDPAPENEYQTRGQWCIDGMAHPMEELLSWRKALHQFIDHLADGKTIEEALSLIQD